MKSLILVQDEPYLEVSHIHRGAASLKLALMDGDRSTGE